MNTRQKRQSAPGVARPFMRSNFAGSGLAWRRSVGNFYGTAATDPVVVTPTKPAPKRSDLAEIMKWLARGYG